MWIDRRDLAPFAWPPSGVGHITDQIGNAVTVRRPPRVAVADGASRARGAFSFCLCGCGFMGSWRTKTLGRSPARHRSAVRRTPGRAKYLAEHCENG